MEGFRKFILRGNVVELAVAVVIGAAFTGIVQSVVKNLITPLLGMIGGIPDFSALSFTINNSRFGIGDLINTVVSFVIVALVIYYLVVVPYGRLMERFSPAPTPPQPTRECPFCLSKIPQKASRCAFCTSEVATLAQAAG